MYTTEWERQLTEKMRPILRALVVNTTDAGPLTEVVDYPEVPRSTGSGQTGELSALLGDTD